MSEPGTSAAAGGHKLNPALEVDVLRGHITRGYAEEIAALREQLEQAQAEAAKLIEVLTKVQTESYAGCRAECLFCGEINELVSLALAASAQPETSPTAATVSAGEQPSKETEIIKAEV